MGNDLVDLQTAAAESNWRRKGYLPKIFTPPEQQLIADAARPDVLVWLLWSMKEATYKIHSAKTGIRSFAPTSLACGDLCLQDKRATGIVRVDQTLYYTRSEINEDFIHSLSSFSSEMLPFIKQEIYDVALHTFDYRARNPACVSHHGRFLALIF
jgi:phosphopantetheinyl transferase (holo-ACP synthase)